MKTIIAGSRTINDYELLKVAIEASGIDITTVVSGACKRGVDALGEQWAENHDIPVERYPADWGKFGRYAGYVRNGEMAGNAEALIALWDGKSRGTGDMIKKAKIHKLQIHVYKV